MVVVHGLRIRPRVRAPVARARVLELRAPVAVARVVRAGDPVREAAPAVARKTIATAHRGGRDPTGCESDSTG